MVNVIGNITEMITQFTNIALSDPLSAISLAFGSLFIAVSVGAFGYLALGAAVDLVTPERSREPPQRAR